MASIFTFDPDPPRVASPWTIPARHRNQATNGSEVSLPSHPLTGVTNEVTASENTPEITRLVAEPQSGPTEYKLHLLMRPRKSLSYTSTPRHASGSRHARSGPSTPRHGSEVLSGSPVPQSQPGASRQHRLEQLTTQLLWRLQQSSPYHSTAPDNLILPSFPEAESRLLPPSHPARLLSGLEHSKGALYEIGVADDGTFVGLTEDELSESLENLRAMAFSLGCSMEVLRKVRVGECEWSEDDELQDLEPKESHVRQGPLYVAEAYIKPVLHPELTALRQQDLEGNGKAQLPETVLGAGSRVPFPETIVQHKEQLRVSLTGATTCGKSTLLGTLSTSTLDNGRGKSRLSLLKHRHEIVSGMTSSIAQELIGYRDRDHDPPETTTDTDIINYAAPNVASWDDIHATSERLAFLIDGAGHPRYRRTTVRCLVGWVPHWTFLCIAANDGTDSLADDETTMPDTDNLDFPGASAHISMAHLDLCLRLGLPLVVVITKIDVASKASIRQVLSAVLTSLKNAGRQPRLLPNDNSAITEDDLQTVTAPNTTDVRRICAALQDNGGEFIVPIVFTSAVKGTGITKLHALLRYLPTRALSSLGRNKMSADVDGRDPQLLFHVNDSFALSVHKDTANPDQSGKEDIGNIISGYLAHGVVAVGDELVLGPFTSTSEIGSEEPDSTPSKRVTESFLSPRSFSDALVRATASPRLRTTLPEWRTVTVVSIRNLRLPVRQLLEDQVGTIGIVFSDNWEDSHPVSIRKGMVLTKSATTAAHSFTAYFDISESDSAVVGSLVIVYCASVRASAKVLAVSLHTEQSVPNTDVDDRSGRTSEDGFGFDFDEEEDRRESRHQTENISVTMRFLAHREYLEVGSKVLVMPSSGHGSSGTSRGIAGLEGFVGVIMNTFT